MTKAIFKRFFKHFSKDIKDRVEAIIVHKCGILERLEDNDDFFSGAREIQVLNNL